MLSLRPTVKTTRSVWRPARTKIRSFVVPYGQAAHSENGENEPMFLHGLPTMLSLRPTVNFLARSETGENDGD